jgi:hypothetical protein
MTGFLWYEPHGTAGAGTRQYHEIYRQLRHSVQSPAPPQQYPHEECRVRILGVQPLGKGRGHNQVLGETNSCRDRMSLSPKSIAITADAVMCAPTPRLNGEGHLVRPTGSASIRCVDRKDGVNGDLP